ncbi:hypothetical protein FB451DRAFT_1392211 [Mycena latifolia]|nr:hypothetical protein FB451DRAFT_1392211 [Mycena latifolia]
MAPTLVTPTLEDVQPFGSCRRHELLHMSFSSPALALDVGDRVVCRRGRYAGQEGYLLDWGIYETEGHAYAMAKIIHTPIAAGPYTRRMKGFWMHRSDLRRHVLCPSPAVRIHDRVTVTAGKEFRGYVGWVTNVEGHIVTMSGCQAPPESEPEETPVTITIEMEFITRDIRKGDLVTVVHGEHKSRQGLIIMRHKGGVLEIFEGTAYHSGADHEEEVAAKIFLVNRADVNFLLADDILKPSAPYTAHSHVPHPAVPIPRPAFQPENALLRREEDWESYDADALAQASVFDKILEIAPPASLASLAAGLDEINDKQQSLLRVGKRYERIFVKVVGSKHGVSVHKGRRGMVVGDYDSKERSERLKLQNLKKRWNTRGDTRGIMVTIRDATNRQFHVEIEMVVHEAFALASPVLEGESTGAWFCQPTFAGKRLDVIILGIIGIVKMHYWQASKSLISLEKKMGYLLLQHPIPAQGIEKKKVEVYGVGNNGLSHKVPAIYIKPLRQGPDGQPITKIAQRVVVVGGDIERDMSAVGAYAETRPEIVHPHGEDVVAVRLEGGEGPFFFHILHLCRSTNTSLTLGTTTFPATTFV